MSELPDWAADAVYVDTGFHFDFKDRLKILFGWTVYHYQGVACSVPPGRTQVTETRVSWRRPGWWPWKSKLLGYAEKGANPMTTDKPKSVEQWRPSRASSRRIEYGTIATAAKDVSISEACDRLNSTHQALLDTVAALEAMLLACPVREGGTTHREAEAALARAREVMGS